jgi:hypothetical protein
MPPPARPSRPFRSAPPLVGTGGRPGCRCRRRGRRLARRAEPPEGARRHPDPGGRGDGRRRGRSGTAHATHHRRARSGRPLAPSGGAGISSGVRPRSSVVGWRRTLHRTDPTHRSPGRRTAVARRPQQVGRWRRGREGDPRGRRRGTSGGVATAGRGHVWGLRSADDAAPRLVVDRPPGLPRDKHLTDGCRHPLHCSETSRVARPRAGSGNLGRTPKVPAHPGNGVGMWSWSEESAGATKCPVEAPAPTHRLRAGGVPPQLGMDGR